jgi:hypothetical protein
MLTAARRRVFLWELLANSRESFFQVPKHKNFNVKIWQGAVNMHKSCLIAPSQIFTFMFLGFYVTQNFV